jgi:hypothetical protein
VDIAIVCPVPADIGPKGPGSHFHKREIQAMLLECLGSGGTAKCIGK